MRGRISDQAQEQRERLETIQARLLLAAYGLDETILRQKQALRRSPNLGSVLHPALERLLEIQREVKQASALMKELWSETRNE